MKGLSLVRAIEGQTGTHLLVIAISFVIGLTPEVRADVVTFAQFTQQTVSEPGFGYTDNKTGASFGSVAGGIPIFLTIPEGFAPNLPRVESARLFLTSSTATPTIPPVSPDQFTQQHFTGLGNMLQIILDTPVEGKTNFLTVTFTDGLFSGRLNSTEASLKASGMAGDPSQVHFISDFIDFSGATENGLSLSFSSVNSTDGSGDLQLAEDGFFKSFTASGTGTFDTAFAAPVAEPSSLVLAFCGLLGLLGFAWKYGKWSTWSRREYPGFAVAADGRTVWERIG